jgi:hypothetical protein
VFVFGTRKQNKKDKDRVLGPLLCHFDFGVYACACVGPQIVSGGWAIYRYRERLLFLFLLFFVFFNL